MIKPSLHAITQQRRVLHYSFKVRGRTLHVTRRCAAAVHIRRHCEIAQSCQFLSRFADMAPKPQRIVHHQNGGERSGARRNRRLTNQRHAGMFKLCCNKSSHNPILPCRAF